MIFRAIFISFKSQELVFQLNDDEVDDPMRKKLMKLGLPDIQFDWPENDSDSFQELPGGFYRQGDFACSGIRIARVTNEARYSATFNPDTNNIAVMLDGLFFCINTVDDDISSSLKQKEGFVGGARFRDSKNKIINKPKDQWGISSPIEGRIVRESYDCQKVKFNITAKEGTFTDGNMVQNI